MSDHVSIISPPLAVAAPADPARDEVAANGWWPALSMAEFRSEMRITDIVTEPRCRRALRAAIQTALIDLDDWSLEQLAIGKERLEDVPCHVVDGIPAHVLNWQRAVYTLAKAELIETHRDYDATGEGERRADWVDDTIIQLRRDAAHAIRDIKGRRRTFVELI